MAKVKVYKVKVYSINTDEYAVSRRMATRDGAAITCGVVLENGAGCPNESRQNHCRGEDGTCETEAPEQF